MSRCGLCDSAISRSKQSIICSGFCKAQFHISCIGITAEFYSLFQKIQGLSWKCNACISFNSCFNESHIHNIIEQQCSAIFTEINNKFEILKEELKKNATAKLSEIDSLCYSHSAQSSYSQIVSGKQPNIVIKPKNKNQENSQTKSDILKNIDPINTHININKVKHIKEGGILVGCNSESESSKFKQIAGEKLADNYEIHELKSIHPRVRVVGITEKIDEAILLQYIRRQNTDLFDATAECEVLRLWPTKNKTNIFQATLQVDQNTYKKVINRGHLLIGLDTCTIYDALHVPRCFNCNAFHHNSKFCKNVTSCPLCSENHELKVCTANQQQYKCSNCISIAQKQKIDINSNHAVWDYNNCFAYKKVLDKLKFDVFGSK